MVTGFIVAVEVPGIGCRGAAVLSPGVLLRIVLGRWRARCVARVGRAEFCAYVSEKR